MMEEVRVNFIIYKRIRKYSALQLSSGDDLFISIEILLDDCNEKKPTYEKKSIGIIEILENITID